MAVSVGIQFLPEMFEHESDILREAILWLAGQGVFEWRNNTGVARHPVTGQVVRFGIKGGSDILCVVPPFGRFLGVETKAKRGRQSTFQRTFENAVLRVGGIYVLAKTMEDVRIAYRQARRVSTADRDHEWAAAIESWRECSSKRLTWDSGGHCVHCSKLEVLLRDARRAA